MLKKTCNTIGCTNPVKWIVGKQWYACDDHADEMVTELRENVDEGINKEYIEEPGHVCTCKENGCTHSSVTDILDTMMDDMTFLDGAGIDDKGQPLVRLIDVQKTIIRYKLEAQKINLHKR